MTTRLISVSEFKAHCAEKLRTVATEGCALQITRHGKIIAVVERPHTTESDLPQDGSDYLGKLSGTAQFAQDYDPAESAWPDNEYLESSFV